MNSTCFDNGIGNAALYSIGSSAEIHNTVRLSCKPAACIKRTVFKIYGSLGNVIEIFKVRCIIESLIIDSFKSVTEINGFQCGTVFERTIADSLQAVCFNGFKACTAVEAVRADVLQSCGEIDCFKAAAVHECIIVNASECRVECDSAESYTVIESITVYILESGRTGKAWQSCTVIECLIVYSCKVGVGAEINFCQFTAVVESMIINIFHCIRDSNRRNLSVSESRIGNSFAGVGKGYGSNACTKTECTVSQ